MQVIRGGCGNPWKAPWINREMPVVAAKGDDMQGMKDILRI